MAKIVSFPSSNSSGVVSLTSIIKKQKIPDFARLLCKSSSISLSESYHLLDTINHCHTFCQLFFFLVIIGDRRNTFN